MTDAIPYASPDDGTKKKKRKRNRGKKQSESADTEQAEPQNPNQGHSRNELLYKLSYWELPSNEKCIQARAIPPLLIGQDVL
ncbi:unnamed protein product, partial [Prunus brigantina]